MSNEFQMNYEAYSLRKFLSSEGARHLDRTTKMALKMSIRKQAIRNMFQFESIWQKKYAK